MKIGLICTEMLPSPAIRGGAIQILIDGIAPHIAANHELTVFSISDPELLAREKINNIEYIRFPKDTYVDSVAEYLRNTEPFDVIHVFNRPRSVYTYKQAAPSTNFVLSLHNEMFHPKKISDTESMRCLECVDNIMTVSKYIAATVISRIPEAKRKVKVIYSGVDLSQYSPIWEAKEKRNTLRKEHGLSGKSVIMFVGRLSEKKGPHILLKAFEKIVPEHPEAVLMIVGGRWFSDDGVDKYVKQLYKISEPIKDKVIFTKFISPAHMPDYYLMADVFVCSSQWQEPLARVHYEAMAAGLPIITTDRGGNAEVVRNNYNGIVIRDFREPEAFAGAISSLLSNRKLALKLGRSGWDLAKRYCNFSRVANDLLTVYKKSVYTGRKNSQLNGFSRGKSENE